MKERLSLRLKIQQVPGRREDYYLLCLSPVTSGLELCKLRALNRNLRLRDLIVPDEGINLLLLNSLSQRVQATIRRLAQTERDVAILKGQAEDTREQMTLLEDRVGFAEARVGKLAKKNARYRKERDSARQELARQSEMEEEDEDLRRNHAWMESPGAEGDFPLRTGSVSAIAMERRA